MSLLRDLHPSQDLDRYEVIPSWGGYPITLVAPAPPLVDQAQMELRLRRENSARRQRALRKQAKAL